MKLGVHKETGEKVAIKMISKKEMAEDRMQMMRREIQIMKICQHPNITQLIEIYEDHSFICIGK